MVTGGGWGDSGWEGAGWGLGKVEEVLGKMLTQGIEVWWPEEGDRRKGTTAERAELVSGRWDEEEGGYDNRGPQLDKYLGVTWADRPPL